MKDDLRRASLRLLFFMLHYLPRVSRRAVSTINLVRTHMARTRTNNQWQEVLVSGPAYLLMET